MNYFFLGIQSYASHDSGAALVKYNTKKNKVSYVCISEERLNRIKHPYSFPLHSINYCLEYFGLKNLSQVNFIISDWIKEKKWHRSGPSYNYSLFDYYKEKLRFDEKKIIQIDHHLAHAASVYYTSSFKESSILIVDGLGSDLETTSFYRGKNSKIELIEKYKEHGIGTAYGAVTSNILKFGTGGEGKTMGLAPYGNKHKNQININLKLNGISNNFSSFMRRLPQSDVLNQINSNYRINPLKVKHKQCINKNHLDPYFSGVAFDIQNCSEKVMIHLGKEIFKKNKSQNICIAGGVALNSVANKKLLDKSNFKNIFVFPACSDAGIPFGAALWGLFNLTNKIKKDKIKINFNDAYTGKIYPENETIKILDKFKIKYSETNFKEIAKLIAQGKIIARCCGRSEYGPRALGNRSILADARNSKMRDYLNIKIKHREIFRPFAPIVLEEKSKKFFDLNQKSPFMLLVAKCFKPKIIPSAIHVDNTARVQTINKTENLDVYKIIKEFEKITGVPIILNTSFNDAGEPMVESPLDSIICFLKTGIDYLVIDNFLINKSENKKINFENLQKYRKKIINFNEKKINRQLFKNFEKKEFRRKKIQNNKLAVYRTLNFAINKLKNFLKNKKNILFYGTSDHTYACYQLLKKKFNFETFGYYDIGKNDFLKKKFNIKFSKNSKKNLNSYDAVFISSFEYQSEIKNKLLKKINQKKIICIYDNSSRSLIDVLLISKWKGKKKIYHKGINTAL